MKKNFDTSLKTVCGKTNTDNSVLKEQIVQKATELCKIIKLAPEERKSVTFWTEDIPELVCVAEYKNNNGLISFNLDYSQSTL